ncbi:hypothetical protein AX14_004549 [Amanita brunnescens Koide BX004]|nr:hypothetical protein AX14_004549 [Amanita brunnescens Koide BX004]
MASSTSSGMAVKAVRRTAKAAAEKWAALVPVKAKANASGHNSASHKSATRKWQSLSEASSEDEVVVVKSVKKKARIAPEVEDEVVTEAEKEDIEESEDVIELDAGDEMEKEPEELDAELPEELVTKRDQTRDLRTIFSEKVWVRFKCGEKFEQVYGRWCNSCRHDKHFVRAKGVRRAFFTGSNTSCRAHIRCHYSVYKTRCEEEGIKLNNRCVPRELSKVQSAGASLSIQTTLDSVLEVKAPSVFSKEAILHAVAQLVACDDQALALVGKDVFRNCLITMRPKTRTKELPTPHDVIVYLHNAYIKFMNQIKEEFTDAPGQISVTADAWTADTTRASFFGMTGHWIDVKEGNWKLRSTVIGFRAISGDHSGHNLARYFVSICKRAGIITEKNSKLGRVTVDNTANNLTMCEKVSDIHQKHGILWNDKKNQLPCLEHVINLATVAVMDSITKVAAIESVQAIWEFDPTLDGNRVLGGSLDVIAAIRTIAIKIRASRQRIEYFEQLQASCKLPAPFKKLEVHNNTRWGTAYGMVKRALELRQPIALFIAAADDLFGPITTIRSNGKVEKKIPWSAFRLSESDWARVEDVKCILKDARNVQHKFAAESVPTLYNVLPAVEELLSAWESKITDRRYTIFVRALKAGIDKLKKYYSQFDLKPAILINLALHPYFKLDWILLNWGGSKEQEIERAKGNLNAKNWKDEARKVLEDLMAQYWEMRPHPSTADKSNAANAASSLVKCGQLLKDFHRHREQLAQQDKTREAEDWQSELRLYLKVVAKDVLPETDVVKWWQNHAAEYPTLARIALDYLPSQASAVPCERLFSATKQTAVDRRARLGTEKFEQLQVLKFAWRGDIPDLAAANQEVEDEVDLTQYDALYYEDITEARLDAELEMLEPEDDAIILD